MNEQSEAYQSSTKFTDSLKSTSTCAVVIPVHRWPLAPSEEFSVRKTIDLLGAHDLFWVGPKKMEGIPPTAHGGRSLNYRFFPDTDFATIKSYNRLMMSRRFYSAFRDYQYVLVVQTDALVLRDELKAWCASGYSYVGAPWFKGFSRPDPAYTLMGVGNGGFSLRSVPDALRFLSRPRYTPHTRWIRSGRKWTDLLRFIKHQVVYSYNFWPFTPRIHEDNFWGMIAPASHKAFTVPSPQEALRFAFEVAPEKMYDLAGGALPFGCHAWEHYGKGFWLHVLGDEFFETPNQSRL